MHALRRNLGASQPHNRFKKVKKKKEKKIHYPKVLSMVLGTRLQGYDVASRASFPPLDRRISDFWFLISDFRFPFSVFRFPFSVFLFPISDFPFPISDFWFLISDFWFPFSVFRFPFSVFRFPIFDFRFPISDFRFPISDFRFLISDFWFRISDFGFLILDFLSPDFWFLFSAIRKYLQSISGFWFMKFRKRIGRKASWFTMLKLRSAWTASRNV